MTKKIILNIFLMCFLLIIVSSIAFGQANDLQKYKTPKVKVRTTKSGVASSDSVPTNSKENRKRGEVHGKFIAMILTLIIMINFASMIISVDKIGGMHQITGYAGTNISRGNVTLTISDVTWINFSRKAMSWGTGYALKVCTMNVTYENVTGCSATFAPPGANQYLQIKNIGNNNVSLNITFKNGTAFLGGVKSELWFKFINGSTGAAACTDCGCKKGGNASNFKLYNRVWRATQSNLTCDRMYYGNGQNTVSLDIKVAFDQNALTGTRLNQIIAYGKTRIG